MRAFRYLVIPSLLVLSLMAGSTIALGASQSPPAPGNACPSPTMIAGTSVPATLIPTTASATEIAYQTAAAQTVAVTQRTTESATQQATEAPTATGTATGCPAIAAKVSVGSFYFKPNKLTIPATTNVTFTITNADRIEHYFVIHTEKVQVKVELTSGKTVSTTLNLPKGTYEFYCVEPGHKLQGMVGQIIAQ